jgi:hypothetical protein
MDPQRHTWTYLPFLLGTSKPPRLVPFTHSIPPSPTPVKTPTHDMVPFCSFHMTHPFCLVFRLFSCMRYERSEKVRSGTSTQILECSSFPLPLTLYLFILNYYRYKSVKLNSNTSHTTTPNIQTPCPSPSGSLYQLLWVHYRPSPNHYSPQTPSPSFFFNGSILYSRLATQGPFRSKVSSHG